MRAHCECGGCVPSLSTTAGAVAATPPLAFTKRCTGPLKFRWCAWKHASPMLTLAYGHSRYAYPPPARGRAQSRQFCGCVVGGDGEIFATVPPACPTACLPACLAGGRADGAACLAAWLPAAHHGWL
eukprot:SAG22_NODE_2123_length_2975_cov_22.253477_2_plen_127_part_00